jgi:hypothetical protein
MRLRLDQQDIPLRGFAECIPLRPSGGPKLLQGWFEIRLADPFKKTAIAVLSKLV